MFNRLSELKGGKGDDDVQYIFLPNFLTHFFKNDFASRGARIVNPEDVSASPEMSAYLDSIKQMQTELNEIEKNTTEIERNQQLLVQAASQQKNRAIKVLQKK